MKQLLQGASHLGIDLDVAQMSCFDNYYRELLAWNRRVNLTSVTGYDQVQTRHFLDSLTVTMAMPNRLLEYGAELVDVGSGGGMPGIPLAISCPRLQVSLLETNEKKSEFLSHTADRIGLNNIKVITGRAETLGRCKEFRERFDIVVSRAVAELSVLVELTVPFCKVGGIVIAQKALGAREEIKRAELAILELGAQLGEIKHLKVPNSDVERILVVIDKVRPTNSRYPRRTGIPSKRPL